MLNENKLLLQLQLWGVLGVERIKCLQMLPLEFLATAQLYVAAAAEYQSYCH